MARFVNTNGFLCLRNGKRIAKESGNKVSKGCRERRRSCYSTEQKIKLIRQNLIKRLPKNSLLLKPGCIDWCFPDSKFVNSLSVESEKKWGISMIGYKTNQWTTKLGESLLKEALQTLGENPRRIGKRQAGENGKQLIPDWETDNGLYECKARTYTTTGTAGEKILGSPWKYSDCRDLYKKPLYIVCMAYQQQEADGDFKLFGSQSLIRQRLLDYYQREAGIQYIRFTDLLSRVI